MKNVIRIIAIVALAAAPIPALAQDDEQPAVSQSEAAGDAGETRPDLDSIRPDVYHVPVGSVPGGSPLELRAMIDGDWKLERVEVHYRGAGESEYRTVELRRASADEFIAIVPKAEVQPPALEYFIASKAADGGRTHFASRSSPHRVVVIGETDETRYANRLARHDGNRNQFELYGEYGRYGARAFQVDGETASLTTDRGTDWMWLSTLEYRHRLLGTLYEISFGVGVIRGHQDTVTVDGETRAAAPVDELQSGEEPGMNYGWGQTTFEFHRNFSIDTKLLLGASATGFAAGVGGTLRLGRLGGTRLELGGEAFQDIGNLAYMGFHWDTIPRVPMGLEIQLTNRPNPNAPGGSRLVYSAGFEFTEDVTVMGYIGSQIRAAGVSEGWMAGLRTSYAF